MVRELGGSIRRTPYTGPDRSGETINVRVTEENVEQKRKELSSGSSGSGSGSRRRSSSRRRASANAALAREAAEKKASDLAKKAREEAQRKAQAERRLTIKERFVEARQREQEKALRGKQLSVERKESQEQAIRGRSYGSLLSSKAAPLVGVKFFREGVGKPLAKGSSFVKEKATGQKFKSETEFKIEKFAGETALLAGLSPVTQTTTQLIKAREPVGVAFKGLQTRTEQGLTKTEARFVTTTGKRGQAEAVGKTIKQLDDTSITVSAARGKVLQSSIRFPSGKIQEKATQKFFGVQFTGSKKVASAAGLDIQKQVSVSATGKVKGASKLVGIKKATSAGFSATKKDQTLQLSKTILDKGDEVYTAGLFSKPPTSNGAGKLIIGGGRKTTIAPPKAAVESTLKQVTTQSVQPVTPPITKVVGLGGLVQSPVSRKQETITVTEKPSQSISLDLKPSLKQKTKLDTTQKEKTKIKEAVKPITKTKSRSRSRFKTLPRQAQLPSQKQLPKQAQKQLPRQAQQLRQVPRLSQKPFVPSIIITPKPSKVPIVPGLIIPKSSPAPRETGKFGVQVRRGGEFRNIGTFGSIDKAFARGVEVTGGTLAATFKITGATKLPKAPKGFRTKKEDDSLLFIEKRSKRLSKTGEKLEIQAAKGRKPKRRKKK